jgi:antitoxin ParD1/3/4
LAIFANARHNETMPTRNINLTDRLDRFIEKEVKSGHYGNASEVVRESLRLLQLRKQEEQAKLKWLRDAVQVGLDQANRGEGMVFNTPEELDAYMDAGADEVLGELPRQKKRA